MRIALTDFVRGKIFDPSRAGTLIRGSSPEEFEAHLNENEPQEVLDGYAPFCKLHVHPNWTRTRAGTLPLTAETEPHLRSGYEARTAEELPVLTRWLEGIEPPVAAYLLVIVYDRAQLEKEGEAVDADWGVVGVLAQMEPVEPPMAPITIFRNALGVEEGGSGVPLDREYYRRSVEFWSRNANVRWTPPEERQHND